MEIDNGLDVARVLFSFLFLMYQPKFKSSLDFLFLFFFFFFFEKVNCSFRKIKVVLSRQNRRQICSRIKTNRIQDGKLN